jgi:hypothetical protein
VWRPAQLPVLSTSSVPHGTTSKIRSPSGPQDTTELLGVRCAVKTRGACTYEESKGVYHHLRGSQGSRVNRHRRSRVRERADTTAPASESERLLPVQRSRVNGHCQSSVRERAETASGGFGIEPTPLVQRPRESGNRQFWVRERADHGLRCTPARGAALVLR